MVLLHWVCFSPPYSNLPLWAFLTSIEHQRIHAFELWCWRRLLRSPWTARRSNHSILKEINPEYSLEGLVLKLKLQYFGHLMQRADSLEKTLILGKIEGRRKRRQQRMASLTQRTWVWANSRRFFCEGQKSLECCSPSGHKELDATEQLNSNNFFSKPQIFLIDIWVVVRTLSDGSDKNWI